MADNLYWHTVSLLLKSVLAELMKCSELAHFRLVGGTALSLRLGHRISVDIDMFTDADYGSIDFVAIDKYLCQTFAYLSEMGTGLVGLGKSYIVGNDEENAIKLDLYYTEQFIQLPLVIDGVRMATLEDIVAMKIDVMQRGGRKKDFWDLHELLYKYSIEQMLSLHNDRYPYNHDEMLIKANFINFSNADEDFEPICLRGKYWELIKLDIIEAMQ